MTRKKKYVRDLRKSCTANSTVVNSPVQKRQDSNLTNFREKEEKSVQIQTEAQTTPCHESAVQNSGLGAHIAM
jgi:hypothetical protein